MKSKLTAALLALFLCLTMTAQAESSDHPMDITGYWPDSWSQRAHMTITFDGEEHRAVIHWANSAFDHIEWRITGTMTDGVLTDETSEKRLIAYDEDGVREELLLYDDQPATLLLSDGVIRWTDSEGMGAECRFERYDEINLADVFNPEQHAYLYVTDVISIAGTPHIKGCFGTIHENGEISGFDLTQSLLLPLSPTCEILLPDGFSDPAAWFGAQNNGFFALIRLNEQGELTELTHSEDQPDAPILPKEEAALIVPAPPMGR